MDGRDAIDSKLRGLTEQFQSGLLSRREFVEAAGVFLGGTTLASLISTGGPLQAA